MDFVLRVSTSNLLTCNHDSQVELRVTVQRTRRVVLSVLASYRRATAACLDPAQRIGLRRTLSSSVEVSPTGFEVTARLHPSGCCCLDRRSRLGLSCERAVDNA